MYVELVFYATQNYAIIKKVNLEAWRSIDADELTTGTRYFVYNIDDIKFYWRKTRKQSDSYDLPFCMQKLRITVKKAR